MLFTKCVRIEFNDFVSAAGLLQKGFREVEELVTYVRETEHYTYFGVCNASRRDIWRCMMIARESFTHDRRHSDGRIPNLLADFVKMWTVAKGFWKKEYKVFVHSGGSGKGIQ